MQFFYLEKNNIRVCKKKFFWTVANKSHLTSPPYWCLTALFNMLVEEMEEVRVRALPFKLAKVDMQSNFHFCI